MPRYDYKCLAEHCGLVSEIIHKIDINPEINCPKCQSVMLRQISKNVMFETPVDVEWEKDPSDLSVSSYEKYQKAKKKKFRW